MTSAFITWIFAKSINNAVRAARAPPHARARPPRADAAPTPRAAPRAAAAA